MTITLAIPAYNEENYIGPCLQSVLAAAPDNLIEILVINNASTDKTAEVAASFDLVRVINEPLKGLTRARQKALLEAKGDLLAFVDADSIMPKKWFDVLNREFKNNPELICLSGPYRYYGIEKVKNIFVAFWYKVWFMIWYGSADFFIAFTRGYVVVGGNFVAKKQALWDMGGFDTKIEFYGEDTDVARRLNKLGKIKYVKDFWIRSSARRFNNEGLVLTGIRYLANYISVIFLKKPVTKGYKDIR